MKELYTFSEVATILKGYFQAHQLVIKTDPR